MHSIRLFIAWTMLVTLLLATLSSFAQDQRDLAVLPKAPLERVPIAGEYWALLIGIDKYKHVEPLKSAVRDVTAVKSVLLERYGFTPDHITLVLNEQATRENIEDTLYEMGRKVSPNDSLLIYYAGHGQMDLDSQRGYWIPVDGKAKSTGTWISNARLRDDVAAMKARHVYLVADSCFSGTLFARSRALPTLNDKFFLRLYENKSRWGLTSGQDEPVADWGKGGHSLFAYFFIKLLRENEAPYLVPSQIYDRVAPLVANNATQQPQSQPLQGAGDEGGQFVFRLATATSPPIKKGPSVALSQAEHELKALQAQEAQIEVDRTSVEEERRLQEIQQQIAQKKLQIVEKKKAIEEARARSYEAPQQAGKETGKDGAPMVLVPSGDFLMGSAEGDADEKPVHRVTLDAFYLDKYEVTNKLFQKFVRDTGYETTAEKEGKAWAYVEKDGKWQFTEVTGANWRKPEGGETVFVSNRDEHPVVSVSWHDAEAYCRWAGKRLPTEAEFEYANRGGTRTTYWWGDGNPGSRRVANIADEAGKRKFSGWTIMTGYDDGYVRTAPVGSFEPNPFGLHDLTGNALEWTADWYGKDYYERSPSRNPTGPSGGEFRVLRGGSWGLEPQYVRSASRYDTRPTLRYDLLGFRCAKTP